MTRSEFLRYLAYGAAATMTGGLHALQGDAGQPPPNIVFILADDLGYGDLILLNAQSKIRTPNLERMAAEGVIFTDAHSPSAVCTPTRYGVTTGRYCWRSPLKSGVLAGGSPPLIEAGRMTVASLLKQNGYATACVGKWHLGLGWVTADGKAVEDAMANVDFGKPFGRGPTTLGFDYYYGISASLDMPPYIYLENDRATELPTSVTKGEPQMPRNWRLGPLAPGFKHQQVLSRLTETAAGWIDGWARQKSGKPFFLYLALNAPHTPVLPREEFKGRTGAGDYGDFVTEVDWTVGQVLDAVRRTGAAGNTLVIVTSDNGPENIAYQRVREYQHYSMGNLRGVKRDLWEGGHRVPFLARWPGKIKPGTVSGEIVCLTDLMATCADIVHARLPDNAGEDSYSILPALLGRKPARPIREATVLHSAQGQFAIRQGSWLFIDHPTGDNNREPEWLKQERHYEPHKFPGELYNLRDDLAERKNLYGERQDVAQKLKALLEKYKAEGRSAPGKR
jgi:arylsulfatase A-like enzyme